MLGSVTVGGQTLMGADVVPDRYEEAKGFSLSLQMQSTADERQTKRTSTAVRPRRLWIR